MILKKNEVFVLFKGQRPALVACFIRSHNFTLASLKKFFTGYSVGIGSSCVFCLFVFNCLKFCCP